MVSEALEADREDRAWWIESGKLELDRYQWDAAMRAFERAARCGPADGLAESWMIATLDRRGRRHAAEELAERMVDRYPKSVPVLIAACRLHEPDEPSPHVDGLAKRILEEDPVCAWGWRYQIAMLDASGDTPAAAKTARDLAEAHADDPKLLEVAGDALEVYASGPDDEACKVLQQALVLQPDDVGLLQSSILYQRAQGRWHQTEAAAETALTLRQRVPVLRVEAAMVTEDKGDYEAAMHLLDEALGLCPGMDEALKAKARLHGRLGEWEEAEAAIDQWQRARPDDVRPVMSRAWLLSLRCRHDEAADLLDLAARCHPDDDVIWSELVAAAARAGRIQQARQAGRHWLRLLPDHPAALIQAGYLLGGLGLRSIAAEAYQQAWHSGADDAAAFQWRIAAARLLEYWDQAMTAARDALTRRSDLPDTYVEYALAAYAGGDGDVDAALGHLDQALERDPCHLWAHRSRVAMLSESGRVAEAAEAAREGFTKTGASPLEVDLARSLWDAKQPEEALRHARHAVARFCLDPDARQALIGFHLDQGNWDDAAVEADTARCLLPDDADMCRQPARVALAQAVATGNRETGGARQAVDQALRIHPTNAASHELKIDILSRMGMLRDAEEAARAYTRLRPEDTESWTRLAQVYSDLNQPDDALTATNEALRSKPNDRLAWRRRIVALMELGRTALALREIDRTEFLLDDPVILALKALMMLWRYDYPAAEECLEKVLTMDPAQWLALSYRVDLWRAQGRFEDARNAAEDFIDTYRDRADPEVSLGRVYADQARYDDAGKHYKKAVEKEKSNATAIVWLARAEYHNKKVEAEGIIRDALRDNPNEPLLVMELSLILGDTQRDADAVTVAKQAMELAPWDADIAYRHADALRAAGRDKDAEKAVRSYTEKFPHVAAGWTLLGGILEDRHDYHQAMDAYQRGCTIDADDDDSLLARCRLLQVIHCYQEASDLVKGRLERHPGAIGLLAEQTYIDQACRKPDAGSGLRSRLQDAITPREKAVANRVLGHLAMADSDYETAAKYIEAARTVWEDDPETSLDLAGAKLGQARAASGRDKNDYLNDVVDLATQALESDSKSSRAHYLLGIVSYEREDNEGGQEELKAAESHLRRAIELSPWDGPVVDLGVLYTHLGRYDEAQEQLERALGIDKSDVDAHVCLGNLYVRRADSEPDNSKAVLRYVAHAKKEYETALSLNKDNPEAVHGIAISCIRLSADLDKAEVKLREILDRDSDRDAPEEDGPIYTSLSKVLAEVLIMQGRATEESQYYEDALDVLHKALHKNAGDPGLHHAAGYAEEALAQTTRNIDIIQRRYHVRKALYHFEKCQDPKNGQSDGAPYRGAAAARREQRKLKLEQKTMRHEGFAPRAVAVMSAVVLAATWYYFIFGPHRVTAVMATTLTPILIGLTIVAFLLPLLVHLKLPGGFEADLSPAPENPLGLREPGEGLAMAKGEFGQLPKPDLPTWKQLEASRNKKGAALLR